MRRAARGRPPGLRIYPLVEESEKIDLKAATAMADHLSAGGVPRVSASALLHGRMKADEKDRVMKAFAAGELDLLVSTTVVEVGIDVPNATVMLIEHAERFGLSQLHQLRGRVGRGAAPVVLLSPVPVATIRRCARAAAGDDRHLERLRDRGARSAAPRTWRSLRDQAGRPPDVSTDRSGPRSGTARNRPPGSDPMVRPVAPAGAAIAQLLKAWADRFHLIEVG